MLTGREIVKRMTTGQIVITPFDEKQLNPNSYNLRLGPSLLIYKKALPIHEKWQALYEEWRALYEDLGEEIQATGTGWPSNFMGEPLDMAVEEETTALEICPKEGLVLYPDVLYLGSTEEYTETYDLVPCIEGRSSAARLGLSVHLTAGFGDCQFKGHWTLELTVHHPLRVYAGVQICQIAYTEACGEITAYHGKYQGQRGPRPSGLWKELRPQQ